MYIIILTEWRHGIGHYNIITFSKELENVPTAIIELTNIDDSSYKAASFFLELKHTK